MKVSMLWRFSLALLPLWLGACGEPICGDRVLQGEEGCDDGNVTDGDGCDSNCTETACGNSVITDGEECDDGNANDTDSCVGECLAARCNDGFIQSGVELCDDGNTINNDECTTVCEPPRCGDSFVFDLNGNGVFDPNDGDEECDDGDQDNLDACTNECENARCGDLFVQPSNGEQCDDGNQDDTDGCTNTCQSGTCGDSIIQTENGEQCDDGNVNNVDGCIACALASCGDNFVRVDIIDPQDPDFEECDDGNTNDLDDCTTQCRAARCGDGLAQSSNSEQCDDGNQDDTDGCTNTCELSQCGDGITRLDVVDDTAPDFEECDDGNTNNFDGCTTICLFAACGDGITQLGNSEQCDDNNAVNDDACTNDCKLPRCGDGVLQLSNGEQCDDGNTSNSDACSNICRAPLCGDSITQTSNNEQCDDGNTINTDSCTGACQTARCGDSFVQGIEQCDDGNAIATDICNNCQSPRCGDGFTQTSNGEQCDDANQINADACSNTCQNPRCGDGITQSGEQCDDGNANNEDSCLSSCQNARCGDGFVQGTEVCDDGNAVNTDACTTTCQTARCGDGFVQAGEQCDDSNAVNNDGCSNTCQSPRCGDAITQSGEQCDDGNAVNTDACTTACQDARCGDSFVQGTEQCDDGNANNLDACSNTCLNARCGDSLVQTSNNEACDDGNAVNNDACSNVCRLPSCGDAIVQSGEQCDDGNAINTDVCTTACLSSRCGDGFVQGAEVCDDGNAVNTDTCTNACLAPRCGDSFVQAGEQCDDGNSTNTDACANTCQSARCGDGFTQSGEQCDDGNAVNTDTCTNVCQNLRCGDGFVQAGEVCDDGNAVNTDTCTNSCLAPRCGDSFLQSGEQCDDGNATNNDACSNICQSARCGDAISQSGEQCDDGNAVNTDTCTTACQNARCGDSFVQPGVGGEQCDDSNATNNDACSNICRLAQCGDGIVQASNNEQCEDGNALNNDACVSCRNAFCGDTFVRAGFEDCDDGNNSNFDACTTACDAAFCGDGLTQLDLGEECDDQNGTNTDICTNACLLASCGDNIVQAGVEQCDDNNAVNTDACTNSCQAARCGDGLVQAGVEQCDDGNPTNNDECTNVCQTPRCGDGIVQGVEQCDDGDTNDGDDCTNACENAVCGDGVVQLGIEECDDGNSFSGDGCEPDCTPSCGNGVLEANIGEECDDANFDDDDGCNIDCNETKIIQIATGNFFSCSLSNSGNVVCWGSNNIGQLGYGNQTPIGDNETPASAGSVNVGGFVTQITAGDAHVCALLDTGAVRCWGLNVDGRLGYGIFATAIGDNEVPSTVGDVNIGGFVTQIAAGSSHTCALLTGGNVRCWGLGAQGQLGYGNTDSIGDDETPASAGNVNIGGTVVQISAGEIHTCALLDTGAVRCWGNSDNGQLGYANTNTIGDNENPASAGNVNTGISALKIISGAGHNCILSTTGTVKCWGDAETGQLGYGNVNNIGDNETPATVGTVSIGAIVKDITAGALHTCALLDNGGRCWGLNAGGILGAGNLSVPAIGDDELPSIIANINFSDVLTNLFSGPRSFHSCAILGNRRISCWGEHDGLGNLLSKNIGDDEPVNFENQAILTKISQISAGGLHTCALLDSGNVRCWGNGFSGRLGYGNEISIGDNEVPASAGNVNIGGAVTQITTGDSHTCALLSTGNVRCWGSGSEGRLGYGNTNNIGDNEAPTSAGNVNIGGSVTQIAAGFSHTCALLAGGTVRCWGTGSSGQLGYGNINSIGDNETPASAGDVNVGGVVTQIAAGLTHTCAILVGGVVRCWGTAGSGQLGYGNQTQIGDNETPASAGNVNVGGIVTQLSLGGSHSCALLSGGTVRCWGFNNAGQLGYGIPNLIIGNDETPSTAGDVNIGQPVIKVAAGGQHTCAILKNGAVKCWGSGVAGQLGYGNENSIGDNEVVATAGNIDLGGVAVDISAGIRSSTCAIINNNQVKCWGDNSLGKLGYGNITNIGDNEVPFSAGNVQIGTDITKISSGGFHSCAIINGAIKCWGSGGGFGYGNTNNIGDNEAPTSVGTVNIGGTPVQISAGSGHTCVILSAGNVRCFGVGALGQLGYGNQTNIGDNEIPASAGDVSIAGTAIQISTGFNHSCAVLTGGSVRCWGDNAFGQIGTGNTTAVGDNELPSSIAAVNVGGVVIKIATGDNHTCVVLDTGDVRCWGLATSGQLGYRNTNNIGDNETPASAGTILLSGFAIDITAGSAHTCVLLNTGDVRCWGAANNGQLGYGNINNIGDNEAPAAAGNVNLGGFIVSVDAGQDHTCATRDTGEVFCWGLSGANIGRLGYGNLNNIGDNELPISVGPVVLGEAALQVSAGSQHTCVLLDSGNVQCWGSGGSGQLGNLSISSIGDDETPSFINFTQVF